MWGSGFYRGKCFDLTVLVKDHDMQVMSRRDTEDDFLLETRWHQYLTIIHAHRLPKLSAIWEPRQLKRFVIWNSIILALNAFLGKFPGVTRKMNLPGKQHSSHYWPFSHSYWDTSKYLIWTSIWHLKQHHSFTKWLFFANVPAWHGWWISMINNIAPIVDLQSHSYLYKSKYLIRTSIFKHIWHLKQHHSFTKCNFCMQMFQHDKDDEFIWETT